MKRKQKQQNGVHVENQVDDDDAKSAASVALRAQQRPCFNTWKMPEAMSAVWSAGRPASGDDRNGAPRVPSVFLIHTPELCTGTVKVPSIHDHVYEYCMYS